MASTILEDKPSFRENHELDGNKESSSGTEDISLVLHKMRVGHKIKITKDKTMDVKEFAKSLDLDHRHFDISHKKASSIHNYAYFFDIEIERNAAEKTPLKWTLTKKASDFLEFQKELNKELEKEHKFSKDKIPQMMTFFVFKKAEKQQGFLEAAETFLTKLVSDDEIRLKSKVLYEFLEFSLLPLPNGPMKYKEGYLKKRGGGRFKENKVRLYLSTIFRRWQRRWFILTEEGIIYLVDSESTRVREMLLFDQSFKIEYGRKATGSHEGISLVVPNRKLNLKAKDEFEAMVWISEIQKAAKNCPYTKQNRFDSFAPQRDLNNHVKWYVDAEGYYEELYEMLLRAKKEVFITDWWLTPELPLKRPVEDAESEYRVDKVLAKIANAGVRVYIIVYNEVKLLMYNNSDHTKQALESLSPNITVLQHPSEPFFSWSHHEKMVVIDQAIGFVGGFDLCFGRFDNSSHPLFDPAEQEGKGQMFAGKDYSNPRVQDFKDVEEYAKPQMDKKSAPRLPWHDAMIKLSGPVVADLSRHFIQYWNHVEVDVYSKAKEAPIPMNNLISKEGNVHGLKKQNATIRFKNAYKKVVANQALVNSLQDTKKESAKPNDKGESQQSTLASIRNADTPPKKNDENHNRDDDEEHDSLINGSNGSMTSLDNNIKDGKGNSGKKEKSDKSDKSEKPEEKESRGLVGGFKDGVNHILGKLGLKFPAGGKILPVSQKFPDGKMKTKSAGWFKGLCARRKPNINERQQNDDDSSDSDSEETKFKIMKKIRIAAKKDHEGDFTKDHKTKLTKKRIERVLFSKQEKLIEGTCSCQMVRSAARWSMGLNKETDEGENSIENAYVEIIKNTKSFLYIENQFFMSATAGKTLKNRIGHALVERIERAHANKERLRILVFLPLTPEFEGEITDSGSGVVRVEMYWQYVTICRGETSIYESLRSKGIKPEDYIQFYSLRTHARMPNGQPASEQIYIHSKILISDDNVFLIGSANINDRSLLGSRDSEIAMVVEDNKKMESLLNGQKVQVSETVCTFRRRLLAEHLGLSEEEVIDPITDEFTQKMNERIKTNTEVYREVFACYPDDTMKTYKEVEEASKKKNLDKYDELKGKIQGHAVFFPLNFLENEKLGAEMSSMEYYIPDETYV